MNDDERKAWEAIRKFGEGLDGDAWSFMELLAKRLDLVVTSDYFRVRNDHRVELALSWTNEDEAAKFFETLLAQLGVDFKTRQLHNKRSAHENDQSNR